MDLYVLKTKEGKSFEVKMFGDQPGKPQLCVVDSQDCGTMVDIRIRYDTQMAFGFKYQGEFYFQKATENSLELVKGDSLESDCYWFEKHDIGGGEHYCLKTVARPLRYLTTYNSERFPRVTLSKMHHVAIRESTTSTGSS